LQYVVKGVVYVYMPLLLTCHTLYIAGYSHRI
jgi:hypothetical protein